MKLFRNLLIATAAVAVFAGVSAFAEGEGSDTVNYDFSVDATNVATNVVSVAADEVAGVINGMGDQVTVVVVPAGSTEITDANIYYINQDANGNATVMLTGMGTKALAADTDYEVWVGGSNGTIKKGTFTTKVATPDEPDEPEVPSPEMGDVNNDEWTDLEDAFQVMLYDAGLDSILINEEEWRMAVADVNADEWVDLEDAFQIMLYDAGFDSDLDQYFN